MCEGLSIPLSEVVAIGDDDNDAEMLESAGLAGIAMKYAAVGAKQAVDLGLEWMDH